MNFAPGLAPDGVTLKFLPRPSGVSWTAWQATYPPPKKLWESRRIIIPRLILVHTNGASGEGTIGSAFNWSMGAPSNTKPHYQVDRDGSAAKFLPSDREGIANYQVSRWSLAIETADAGYGAGKPGQACAFTPAQAETVALIIAYESELWDIPIQYPTSWDGTGVGCHTEPFGFPFWTNANGKVCPGRQKKLDVVRIIMPRARAIRASWHVPPPPPPPPSPVIGEEEMPFTVKVKGLTAAFIRHSDGTLTWIRPEDGTSAFAKYGPPVEVATQADLAKLGTVVGHDPGPI